MAALILHSLEIVPSPPRTQSGTGCVRVDNCQLITRLKSESITYGGVSPVVVDFKVIGSGGGGGGGVGSGGDRDSFRRYILSVRLNDEMDIEMIALPSTVEDAIAASNGVAPPVTSDQLADTPEPVFCVALDPSDGNHFMSTGDTPYVAIHSRHSPTDSASQQQQQSLVGSLFVMQSDLKTSHTMAFESLPVRFDLSVPLTGTVAGAAASVQRTDLESPPFDRTQPALTFDPRTEMVYMCGGTDKTGSETACALEVESARYSVVENQWWTLPAVRNNRRLHASTLYRSHLVMAGGMWGAARITEVEALALDPSTGDRLTSSTEWVEWPALPKHDQYNNFVSLAVLDDRLYLAWSEKPSQPEQHRTRRPSQPSTFSLLCLVWDTSPTATAAATDSMTNAGRWCPVEDFPATLSTDTNGFLLVV